MICPIPKLTVRARLSPATRSPRETFGQVEYMQGEQPGAKPAVTARRGAELSFWVPECHRSALLNKMSDPAGATIFTSSGCGTIPDPHADISIGGSLTRCEPGMTRSGPLSGVNAE